MNFLDKFSKYHQTFSIGFVVRGDRSKEGRTLETLRDGTPQVQIMNRISQFRDNIKNALYIYRSPAKFMYLLQTV